MIIIKKDWGNGIVNAPVGKMKTIAVACLENSENLYSSALILRNNNILNTSTSLLVLSLEESIKALVLLLEFKGYSIRNEYKKEFKGFMINHLSKHELSELFWISISMLQILLKGEIKNEKDFDEYNEYSNEISKLINSLDEIKNRGLYVGFLDGSIFSPLDFDLETYDKVENLTSKFLHATKELVNNNNQEWVNSVCDLLHTYLISPTIKNLIKTKR
jgi:AbiV family abortive infection protein